MIQNNGTNVFLTISTLHDELTIRFKEIVTYCDSCYHDNFSHTNEFGRKCCGIFLSRPY